MRRSSDPEQLFGFSPTPKRPDHRFGLGSRASRGGYPDHTPIPRPDVKPDPDPDGPDAAPIPNNSSESPKSPPPPPARCAQWDLMGLTLY